MKIRQLQLKNIGVFDDETTEFQPCPVKDKAEIHIFTGQNGSGKSTILMSLASAFSENPLLNSLQKRFREIKGQIFEDENEIKNQIYVLFDNELFCNYQVPSKGNEVSLLNMKNFIPNMPKNVYESLNDFGNYRHLNLRNSGAPNNLSFAVFTFSGYRQIQSKRVEALFEPKDFNPLNQSLDFIKDYNQENQITINQLIANNISKSAIEKGRNKEKSERFAKVLSSVEQIIAEITGWKIKFDMQTEPVNLVIRVDDEDLEFDVLPDGLRSLISWIADLLGRVDLLKWQDDLPIFEKNLILFLDEIEVHLHPAWQRKVLPVVQKLFKNSQIFVSTHSPFVVNSIDDAWVYRLEVENGKAKVAEVVESENSYSISQVLRDVFGVDEKFGKEVQDKLDKFENLKDEILSNGSNVRNEKELLKLAKSLADEPSDELKQIVLDELRQLSRIKGKEYSL